MNDTIRIAVCQLECHPAIIVGERDYLKEPFVPSKGQPTLADLSRHTLDVSALQLECESQYEEWHSLRLQGVVEWLSMLDPIPDIVVFPECSVPIHDLHLLHSFAVDHDSIVFGGTHTLRLNEADKRHYEALEIPKRGRRGWDSLVGMTVLPVFSKTMSFAHPKGVPSVFEHTDVHRAPDTPQVLKPLDLKFRDRELRALPAVCAEAIQLNAPAAEYDMAVVVAYNDGIEPFLPTISQNTQNQIPVVFCNDGRFGGSSINVVTDHRMNGIWWWNAPIQGLLPPGDAILVADVHLDPKQANSLE